MRPELPPRTTSDPAQHPGRRRSRLLPLLFIGALITVVAAQEIPAMGAWLQRWLHPEASQAGEICRGAALALAAQPQTARVIVPGNAHATQGGFFVEGIQIGEMAESGGETRFVVACYTDSNGRLVRADRIEEDTR
ncbi:MAG: hypothetical protein ABR553_00995 [Gammaproteobacteria bacterium]